MDKPDMQAWARESVRSLIARSVQTMALRYERLALIRERRAARDRETAERIRQLGK